MSSDKSYYLDVEWQEGTPENGKTLYQVPLTYEVEFNNHIYYSTVGDDGNANVSDLRLAFIRRQIRTGYIQLHRKFMKMLRVAN